ncbi:hypothetical protein Desca_1527 [Desulfotomaculum nigrificans CO-1-SRB]|uniref:Uncharacterized protein n=1 Tax=Desulfotomaculum nigrificans (strain DSM 14880 / VKM B-2319 / CO-1-SRB) TaxID=868595 RepID=F6B6K8_DESCC|nr:hypothetical protein [Desulfotomaculum nigrificans]AEF94382.1 hypothetical protein Desca_1527 [Desulfotomaculum nigrificans CO-1-SRB]
MMRIGKIEKPTFEQFKQHFLTTVCDITGQTPATDTNWVEIGDSETRERIIKEFVRKMEQQYTLEIVLKSPLNNKSGTIEGVVGELYHIFSTMFLVEVINSKIRTGERRLEI